MSEENFEIDLESYYSDISDIHYDIKQNAPIGILTESSDYEFIEMLKQHIILTHQSDEEEDEDDDQFEFDNN